MQTIRDILLDNNVPHAGQEHKHGRPGWLQVDCPWCGQGSGKYHMGLSLANGAAVCWRCGKKNTAQVLAMLTGKTRQQMRDRLDGVHYVAAPARKTGVFKPPGGLQAFLPGHRHYLARRGFNPDVCAALWGAMGIGQAAELRWRIYIPIAHHGETVSWTTRAIKTTETQRYVSAPAACEAINHKELLYGADLARHAIVIHEGPLDVWATGPGAVATCGTAYTEAQLRAMSRYPVRVVCFDSEPAAQRRARGLADMLSVYPGTTHNVQLETGKDSGEADPAEIAELRKAFLD